MDTKVNIRTRNDGTTLPICYGCSRFAQAHEPDDYCRHFPRPLSAESAVSFAMTAAVGSFFGDTDELRDSPSHLDRARFYALMAKDATRAAATYAEAAHREDDVTWQAVADATGLSSRQAAQQRYGA